MGTLVAVVCVSDRHSIAYRQRTSELLVNFSTCRWNILSDVPILSVSAAHCTNRLDRGVCSLVWCCGKSIFSSGKVVYTASNSASHNMLRLHVEGLEQLALMSSCGSCQVSDVRRLWRIPPLLSESTKSIAFGRAKAWGQNPVLNSFVGSAQLGT